MRSPSSRRTTRPRRQDPATHRNESPGGPDAPAFIAVGRIAGVFGIAGELKVDLLTDFPERFAPGNRLYLQGAPVAVERSRGVGKDRLLVKLREISTRTQAGNLRGSTLDIREDELVPLPEGAYYRFQLIGLEAWTADGRRLGTVEDILVTGSNDVLVVRGPDCPEVLVPNTADIAEIDVQTRRLTVHVVPGLLPEQRPQTPPRPGRARRRR